MDTGTEGGDPPCLSVVIPSYNSAPALEKNVPALLSHLRAKNISFEVIVVDDGSDDGGRTGEAAARLGCVCLRNPSNMGKGAAVRRGMLHARGRFRLYTDSDVPYELDALDRMLRYLDFKEFHMVVGDRTLPESFYFPRVPILRALGSGLYSFIVGRFVAGGWFDTQCGLKGFRGDTAQDVFGAGRIDGFAFDVECFYIALKRNYDIKRIPVSLRCRDGSSVHVVRHGALMVLDLFRIVLNRYLGRYERKKLPAKKGDENEICGEYQYRACHSGWAPQRFWHRAKYLEAVRALDVREGDRILDAGCGSGVLAELLARRKGTDVLGLDANPRAIEFASRTFKRRNLAFRTAWLEETDLPESRFDKIVSLEVLEHLTLEQEQRTLTSFHRLLAPAGLLVVSTPNAESLWPLLERLLDLLGAVPKLAGDQHERLHHPESLLAAGESAGFRCESRLAINTFAPWLSVFGWRQAMRVHRLETRAFRKWGTILLFVFRKP